MIFFSHSRKPRIHTHIDTVVFRLKGLSNHKTHISYISNDRESDFTKYLHENENNRKSYPQRNNRSKLNYRDLERGMYEEIRQSIWTLDGSTHMNKNNERAHNNGEPELIDLSMDDDNDDDDESLEKSSNDTDETYRRLWCICQGPWDLARLMLRCDSCANWYHGDCIGVTAEQAKTLESNDENFICPPCQGISCPSTKRTTSSEKSTPLKRKRTDETLSKLISPNHATKHLKPNIILERIIVPIDEPPAYCIVHECTSYAKYDWVYCSLACIRRHTNETLEDIQQSKGKDNLDVPTSDDILLYESKSKTVLSKDQVPKIEDLYTWIVQHPSYQIKKPVLPKPAIKSRDLALSFPSKTKFKPSIAPKKKLTKKSIPNKNDLIPLGKPTSKIASNTTDFRSIVPKALYDKIIMRFEKSGEPHSTEHEIRTRVQQIEQEMFRFFGKTDNSYRKKYRSLIATITNPNNNFFYKEILSKDLTAQQIVAMKSDDMLPPEEKVKQKVEFEKEVEMIVKCGEEEAKALERLRRTKLTRQGLVENDAHYSTSYNTKERTPSGEEFEQSENNQLTTMNLVTDKSNEKIESNNQSGLPAMPPAVTRDSKEPVKIPIFEETNPISSSIDPDNDYIEPESPTGPDALIYDDEDNDDDPSHANTPPQLATINSPVETPEETLPVQPIPRADYNPLKAETASTSSSPALIVRLPDQWRGTIHSHNLKLPCQSVHNYGECDYLVSHIPEHLVTHSRVRLANLWEYIRESLAVRDVLILTLTSSSINPMDNEAFVQYVDKMHQLGRATVVNKCPNSSIIRDMYILIADTKECPTGVLSSLFLPMVFESKQLFLVVIASAKRIPRFNNRSNENHSLNSVTYKPVVLQDLTTTRDPRLSKTTDPRLNRKENGLLSTLQLNNTKQTTVQSSNEDLLKLISNSLQRIRQSSTADSIRSIVRSTIEALKSNQRDDLIPRFNDNLRVVMTEWQTVHGPTSISVPAIVVDDNLIEENMDVDDDQEDKSKRSISTSSKYPIANEFKDIDYRFRAKDVDHPLMKTNDMNNPRKPRRKSRFSDILPTDFDRTRRWKSTNSTEKPSPKRIDDKSALSNRSSRVNHTKIASPELIDIRPIRSTLNQPERKYRGSNEWKSRNYYMTHYHDFDQPQE